MAKCKCKNCGVEFDKLQKEIVRNEKLGRNNYCSRKCVGLYNSAHMSYHAGNRRDEFTHFRYHFRNVKKRELSKGIEVTVTLEDLRNQWDKQNGVCPFTGLKLVISEYKKINTNQITSASLDRKDSNKGYTKENIQWVSRAINLMKNDMSEEKTWELCKIISENYITKNPIIS